MTKALMQSWPMSRRSALGLALATTLPLASGAPTREVAAESAAATWTYAGNPARTGVFPGPGLKVDQDVVELWRIDGNGYILDPAGVCDGIIYYLPIPGGVSGDITPLIAVDAETGTELWRHDPPVTEPSTSFWGTAAIADGLLVMPTFAGLLVGMDARTGEERWVFDAQGPMQESRPAIVDGVLYVSDRAAVNAIKLGDTPEWLWKTPLGDGTTTVVSGTVSVDGGFVVVSSVGPSRDAGIEEDDKVSDIHVLNITDGAEAYRYYFRSVGETFQFALEDGNIYSRADNMFTDRSYYFSMSIDGTERWTSRTSGNAAQYPAVRGNLAYINGQDSLWAYDAATGQTVWSARSLQLLNPDIVLIDDVIYLGAAPPAQTIYALSATDGSVLTSIPVPFEGASVIGVTNGVLIARSGLNLVALANTTASDRRG